MVGIYSKIKNYWDKAKDFVKNKALPVVAKIGDVLNSDIVNGISSIAFPALDTVVPGLGTGLRTAKNFIGSVGNKAKGLSEQ
jgi:hypothetical protein